MIVWGLIDGTSCRVGMVAGFMMSYDFLKYEHDFVVLCGLMDLYMRRRG